MARYTGPRLRVLRALNAELPGLTRKRAERRPYPPGQHGLDLARRGKVSTYKKQLQEKQKLRYNYGISEGQFRRYVREAKKVKGATDLALLVFLESRLDNAVFRAGFAPTIPAARQLLIHGHFLINGAKLDRPSYRVRPGDTIALRERSKKIELIKASMADPSLSRPSWLEVDVAAMSATVRELPSAEDVPVLIDPSLIIEYYSKTL